jgi:glutamate formiminotransferase
VSLIAVPNVSEGRDSGRIGDLARAIEGEGARVLDVHSDPDHNRTVFTVAGSDDQLTTAMAELAAAARYIDLRRHVGVHPRLGGLDVCPLVPHATSMDHAVTVALRTAEEIARRARIPVYLYGAAATSRGEARELPSLRAGGLEELIQRASHGQVPDFGPHVITARSGVVCVGARPVLVAFNVWLRCSLATAREIAASVRSAGGGLPGVRALGLALGEPGVTQVSMNLTDPAAAGIDVAFDAVATRARGVRGDVLAAEIVGLVPERFLPDPQREAARLLKTPGRSLESALTAR